MNPPIAAIAMEWIYLKDVPTCPMFDQLVSHLIDSGYVPVRFIPRTSFCRLPLDVYDPIWNDNPDVIWIKSNMMNAEIKRRFGFGTVRGWLCSSFALNL